MPLHSLDGIAPTVPAPGTFWVAPDAAVIGQVLLGEGVGIWFGAVARGDNEPIVIGANSNIQEHCVLHTDMGFPLTVGAGCTIGHRAILHGCTVGDNCLVGMGAIVLNGAVIGENSLVGAGALLPEGREIPPNSLVIGTPGRVVRQLTGDEVERNRLSARHYVEAWKRFASGLT
ncbi:MAG TPA: gamma carbonic anhydrase family protein [Bauldia sp.]|nr:gamma carbonic anhydrase family protein [Bauldia sp.]